MVNGIRTIYTDGLNKGFSSKFHLSSSVQQETPEEGGRRMHWLKLCEYNNEDEDNSPNTLNDDDEDNSPNTLNDEDNSPNTLNDNIYQVPSQKF